MKKDYFISRAISDQDIPYTLSFSAAVGSRDLSEFHRGFHWGQFALATPSGDGTFDAVRDPLGIGKLFYTETGEGELRFSENYSSLFSLGSRIYSLPAGMAVRLSPGGKRELIHTIKSPGAPFAMAEFGGSFRSRMESLFAALAEKEREGWTFFVALSGGLDSTIIASYSSRFLKSPVACTLDLGKSEDSEKSAKIARHLGISHRVFGTDRAQILDALEEAPLLCQDFRDFNVHCAALNILLARNIRTLVEENAGIDKSLVAVLTGDLMNEYTCDYAGEVIDGVEYYKLPRVGRKELQNYLIGGLDTSDREVSPFRAYGLNCIQPYAVLYDLYAGLPESVLSEKDPKKFLNEQFVDSEIMGFLPKVKLRAQVGSRENMGILGLCHSLGINDKTFHRSIMARTGGEGSQIPIFVGRYDVEKFNS